MKARTDRYNLTYKALAIVVMMVFAIIAGATDASMRPTVMTANHNNGSGSSTSSIDHDISPSAKTDVKTYNLVSDNTVTPHTRVLEDKQGAGSYSSNFTWADGLVGKTSVSLSYKQLKERVIDNPLPHVHQITGSAVDSFSYLVGWTGKDYTASTKAVAERDSFALTAASIAFFTIFVEISLPVEIVLGLVESGLSYALESNYVESEFNTGITRGVAESYWTLDNWGQFTVPTGLDVNDYKDSCDSWRLAFSKDEELHAIICDYYDISGYVKRCGEPDWKSAPTPPGNGGLQGKRWYHYWYTTSTTGGPPA